MARQGFDDNDDLTNPMSTCEKEGKRIEEKGQLNNLNN